MTKQLSITTDKKADLAQQKDQSFSHPLSRRLSRQEYIRAAEAFKKLMAEIEKED